MTVGFQDLAKEEISSFYQQARTVLTTAQAVNAQQRQPLEAACQNGWLDTVTTVCDAIATLLGLLPGVGGLIADGVCWGLQGVASWVQSRNDDEKVHIASKLAELASVKDDPEEFQRRYEYLRQNDPLMNEFFSRIEASLRAAKAVLDVETLRRAASSQFWGFDAAGIVAFSLIENLVAQQSDPRAAAWAAAILPLAEQVYLSNNTAYCEIYRFLIVVASAVAEVLKNGPGTEGARELIERAMQALSLALNLQGHGWTLQRIFNPCRGGLVGAQHLCDLLVTGYPSVLNGTPVVAFILIEPYLKTGEILTLGDRIYGAQNVLRNLLNGQFKNYWGIIFVVIHGADPGAVQNTCALLGGVSQQPTVVVFEGRIACSTGPQGTTVSAEIQQLCIEMGLCVSETQATQSQAAGANSVDVYQPIQPRSACTSSLKCRLIQII